MDIKEYAKNVDESKSIVKDFNENSLDKYIDDTLDKMRKGCAKTTSEYVDDVFKSLNNTVGIVVESNHAVGDKLPEPKTLYLYEMFKKEFVLNSDRHIYTGELYHLIKSNNISDTDIDVKLFGELTNDELKLEVCVDEMRSNEYNEFECWVNEISWRLGSFLACKKVNLTKKITLRETINRVILDMEIKK